jgi:large repetitive protein
MFKPLFAFAAGAALASQAFAAGPNLIENGDFEAGRTGFTSDYGYIADPGYYALWGEGTYTVGPNSDQYHGLWADVSDHTTGSGKYMIVNGAESVDAVVWKSNALSLSAGTYDFAAFVTDICCNSFFNGWNALPVLTFTATASNHVPMTFVLDSRSVAVDAPGTWYGLGTTFTLDSDATGYISLSNAEGALSGNDFGLDDISLTRRQEQHQTLQPGVPEPASWAMMVGGFGLIGAAMRRRQRSALRLA